MSLFDDLIDQLGLLISMPLEISDEVQAEIVTNLRSDGAFLRQLLIEFRERQKHQ